MPTLDLNDLEPVAPPSTVDLSDFEPVGKMDLGDLEPVTQTQTTPQEALQTAQNVYGAISNAMERGLAVMNAPSEANIARANQMEENRLALEESKKPWHQRLAEAIAGGTATGEGDFSPTFEGLPTRTMTEAGQTSLLTLPEMPEDYGLPPGLAQMLKGTSPTGYYVPQEVYKFAKTLPEFMSKPDALAMLPIGSAAPMVARLVTAGFGAQAIKAAKEIADNAGENWDKMSDKQQVQAFVQFAGSGLLATQLGVHALAPKVVTAKPPVDLSDLESTLKNNQGQALLKPNETTAPAPNVAPATETARAAGGAPAPPSPVPEVTGRPTAEAAGSNQPVSPEPPNVPNVPAGPWDQAGVPANQQVESGGPPNVPRGTIDFVPQSEHIDPNEVQSGSTTGVAEQAPVEAKPAENAPAPPAVRPPSGQGRLSESGAEVPAEPAAREPISVGPGAASPEDFPKFSTSVKNRVSDQERTARGLAPLMSDARRKNQEVWDAAMEELDRNPQATDELMDDLWANPSRPLTDRDVALLDHAKVEVMNRRNANDAAGSEAARTGDAEGVEAARIESARIEERNNQIDALARRGGTASARGLAFRRAVVAEDYSLTSMETKRRAAKNFEPLNENELADVEAEHKRITDAQKAADEADAAAHQKRVDAELDRIGDDARAGARVRPKKQKDLQEQIEDSTAKAKNKIGKGKRNEIASDAQKLYRHFTEQGLDRDAAVDAVHGVLSKIDPTMTLREVRDAISGYGDFWQPAQDAVSIEVRDRKSQLQKLSAIEDMTAGKPAERTGPQRDPISDENRRLQQQVNEVKRRTGLDLKPVSPEAALKTALDARKTAMRNQIKDLEFQIERREKIVKERSLPPNDAELESMRQIRDQRKAQFDDIFGKPELTDAERLERATKAAEQNLAEWEAKLERAKRGDFGTDETGRRVMPSDAKLEAIRARTEAIRAEHSELRNLNDPAIEAQKVKALNDSIAAIEKKINEHDLAPESPAKKAASPAIEALRAIRDQTRRVLEDARREAGKPERDAKAAQARLDAVNKQIAEYERMIAEGDTAAKPRTPKPAPPELEAARAIRDQTKAIIDQIRRGPPKSQTEIALKALKTRLANRLADLQERTAANDFSPRPKRAPVTDPEAETLRAKVEQAKLDFDRKNALFRLANRTRFEKVLDAAVKINRGFLLSGLGTMHKLASAAASRLLLSPAREVVGYGLSKALPGLARRAPIEGALPAGAALRVEAHAFASAFMQGLKDAAQNIRMRENNLELTYGERQVQPVSKLDFFNYLHKAIKAPVLRSAFTRHYETGIENAIREGRNPNDDAVQMEIGTAAYERAQRDIFGQENAYHSRLNRFINSFEEKDASGNVPLDRKLTGAALRVTFPVLKVPMNLIGEQMENAVGSLTGSVRAAKAYRNGIENLSPQEADIAMRMLKNGLVGAAMMAVAVYNADKFGGFYQRGEKRKEGDTKPGRIEAGGVDLSERDTHHPAIQAAQMAATVARVASQKYKHEDQEKGVAAGVLAGILGTGNNTPVLREILGGVGVNDLAGTQPGKLFGGIVRQHAIPQLLQQEATREDVDAKGETIRRSPKTFGQSLQMGVPGFLYDKLGIPSREQVGEATK